MSATWCWAWNVIGLVCFFSQKSDIKATFSNENNSDPLSSLFPFLAPPQHPALFCHICTLVTDCNLGWIWLWDCSYGRVNAMLLLLFTTQYYFCAHIVFILLSNRKYSAFLNLHHCRTLLSIVVVIVVDCLNILVDF